jgi:hypothetical protein
MQGTVNIYFIWYGNWNGNGLNSTNRISDSPTTKSLLENLIRNISGTSYELVNSSYHDSAGNPASGVLNMARSVTDAYTHGNSLTEMDVYHVIMDHFALSSFDPNKLPLDPNGIYFVLTSSDVSQTYLQTKIYSFPTDFCGWHDSVEDFRRIGKPVGASDPNIRFGFVGNSDRNSDQNEAGCDPPRPADRFTITEWSNVHDSPNHDPGGDGMVNHLMHEINETIVDPDYTSWMNSSGSESEDLCAWNFGTITIVPPSNYAENLNFNGINYLIQQRLYNLDNGYGYCTMQ